MLRICSCVASENKKPSSLSEAVWQRSGGGRRRRDAVGVRGEADKHHKALWWWSERECRSHTFNKRLVLALTNSYTPHTDETHTHTHIEKQSCIPNPAEPPTFANKNGQLEEQRLLLLPPQLSLTAAFYIHADMEHQRLA